MSSSLPSTDLLARVQRAQEGDVDAVESLLREFRPMLKVLVATLGAPGEEREDLIAEATFGAWLAIRQWRPDGGVGLVPYICWVARRKVYTLIRLANGCNRRALNNAESIESVTVEAGLDLADKASDPCEILLNQESYRDLREQARAVLSAFEMQAILALAEGESYKEIAVVTGRQPKQVDNAIHRARLKCKRIRSNAHFD